MVGVADAYLTNDIVDTGGELIGGLVAALAVTGVVALALVLAGRDLLKTGANSAGRTKLLSDDSNSMTQHSSSEAVSAQSFESFEIHSVASV
jgi:hypothetical protein